MASSPTLKVRYALICDAVRREDNGKYLFIGVYSHHIGLLEVPASMLLTVVVGLEMETPGEGAFELEVFFNQTKVAAGQGTVHIAESGTDILLLPNLPLSLTGDGILDFKFRVPGGKWKSIATLPVRKHA